MSFLASKKALSVAKHLNVELGRFKKDKTVIWAEVNSMGKTIETEI